MLSILLWWHPVFKGHFSVEDPDAARCNCWQVWQRSLDEGAEACPGSVGQAQPGICMPVTWFGVTSIYFLLSCWNSWWGSDGGGVVELPRTRTPASNSHSEIKCWRRTFGRKSQGVSDIAFLADAILSILPKLPGKISQDIHLTMHAAHTHIRSTACRPNALHCTNHSACPCNILSFTHSYSVLCSLLSSQHFFRSLDMAKRQVTSVFPHRSPCLLHESSHSKVLRIQ